MTTQHNTNRYIDTSNLLSSHHHHSLIIHRLDQITSDHIRSHQIRDACEKMTTQHNTTLTDIDTTNLLLQHLHHSLIVIRSDQIRDASDEMTTLVSWRLVPNEYGHFQLANLLSQHHHHSQIRSEMHLMRWQHNTTLINVDTSNLLSPHHHHSHQSLCNEPTNQQTSRRWFCQ